MQTSYNNSASGIPFGSDGNSIPEALRYGGKNDFKASTEMASSSNSEALDWDATIDGDTKPAFVPLNGEYHFRVKYFERDRFPGSQKLPPCNKAKLTLEVTTENDPVTVKTDLILCRTLEWKIAAFFRSLGFKKDGERIKMDWSGVVGAEGNAVFKVRSYVNNFGTTVNINDVDKYI